jgi:HEAT repeat protein
MPYLFLLLLSFFCLFSACRESPETAVPSLVTKLSSSESGDRNRAALKLASYGKKAEPAVKPLIRLLQDDNGGVRSSAAYALRQIDTLEARKALDEYQK